MSSTTTKSLQKLTDYTENIEKILQLSKITRNDIDGLSDVERTELSEQINHTLNHLKGEAHDAFLEKIEAILTISTKNQLWEANHIRITQAIASFMNEYARMPTKMELSEKTGLSRQTIHKHIKEYQQHTSYKAEIEQFKFMSSKMLAKMFQLAMHGNVAAAKLYFQVVGGVEGLALQPSVAQQNNYIQINGVTVNLTQEQVKVIEGVLKEYTKEIS